MLPPGPREPAALQTVEWIARPTAFLRRCRARHGEPFTRPGRVGGRADGARPPIPRPSGACSPPTRRCCTVARARRCWSRSPGRRSILLTHGPEHLRQAPRAAARLPRRPPWPAGGRRSPRWRRRRSPRGRPAATLRTLPRMQALTLDVILRARVRAGERPELRAAIRRALDMTASLPRLMAMSLHPRRHLEPLSCARWGGRRPARARDRPRRPPRRLAARRPGGRGPSVATSCATRS